MSSAQERPAGTAGTTDPTGSNAATGGDMPGRGAATSAGTSGYQRVGAHRDPDYQETADYGEAGLSPGRAGGTLLAAVLMIFSGLVTFFYGIAEIVKGTFFRNPANYVFYFSPRGRGITEVVIGAVILAAGVCVLLGMTWARIVGITLAVLSAIANFMFLPWYPVWSVIVIALDVFIIWALATSGRERRMASR